MKDLASRFPIYRKALKLYPLAYQEKYSEQMLQTLADMLDNAPSDLHKLAIWTRAIMDLPISITHQQLHYAGESHVRGTPRFVRRSAIASALMFLPFFVIVIVNDATAHGLYDTWLWSLDVFWAWIVILPAMGLLLSATTLVLWLMQNRRQRTWLQGLSDVRSNWLMSLPLVVGLGILLLVFFHDSVHCVIGNPLAEARHLRATLRCIEQG